MKYSEKEAFKKLQRVDTYIQNLIDKTGKKAELSKDYCYMVRSVYSDLIRVMQIIQFSRSEVKIFDGTPFVIEGAADDQYTLLASNDHMYEFFTKKERKCRFKKKMFNGNVTYEKETYIKMRTLTASKPEIKSALIIIEEIFTRLLRSSTMDGYISNSVHSYRKGRSYATCAKQHAGAYKKSIITYDLSNYFHCITKRMIHNIVDDMLHEVFAKDTVKMHGAKELESIISDIKDLLPNIISSLCSVTAPDKSTTKPVLAMGLEPSGIISNLALRKADKYFDDEFQKVGAIYTRYSDNLIISRAEKFTREEMSIVPEYINATSFCTEPTPFKINKDKTQLKPRRWRQRILGVVVNEKMNISSDRMRWTRSMLNHLYLDCINYRDVILLDTSISSRQRLAKYKKLKTRIRQAQGNICFIKTVNEEKYEKYNTWLYAASMVLKSVTGRPE